jgi:nucleotide-binding universal stress UspA family protein
MASAVPMKAAEIQDILLATDSSAISSPALDYAIALARAFGAVLHILHVLPCRELGGTVYRTPPVAELIPPHDSQPLRETGIMIDHRRYFLYGDVWECIDHFHQRAAADLIILEMQRASGNFNELTLGSTAEEIFRRCCCPVLTIGPCVSKSQHARISRILCPSDLEPKSTVAITFATTLARRLSAALVLLHVLPGVSSRSPEERTQIIAQYDQLLRLSMEASTRDLECKTRVEFGSSASSAIVKAATDLHCDLVVIGMRPRSPFFTRVPENAKRIVMACTCPVLTIA